MSRRLRSNGEGGSEMKIRWTSESVRLRITPSELAGLERGEIQCQAITFPGGEGWAVTLQPDGAPLGLRWVDGQLLVQMSRIDLERLAEPEREGIYLGMEEAAGVRLLIEKDFPCTHPHSEEAAEPETERFTPTATYRDRKGHHTHLDLVDSPTGAGVSGVS